MKLLVGLKRERINKIVLPLRSPNENRPILGSTLLALLFCGLLFKACGPIESEATAVPGLTDSTITIGSWGPLSGPAAAWGSMTHAMDAYFQLINEEGGVHGRKINFVYKDDGYNAARTVPIVRSLVEDENVFALIGGLGTNTGMAVLPYIEAKKVPWVSPGSGSDAWSTPPKQNIFATFGRYIDEAPKLVKYVVDSLESKKIAIVFQNDDFGRSAKQAALKSLESEQVKAVTTISYELGEREMSTQAARLKASGAEIVLLWMGPQQAVALLSSARSLGYRPQWVASTVLSDMERMYDLTEGAWEGVIFGYYGVMPTDTVHPRLQTYKAALARYHPEIAWGAFAETGFIYAEPMLAALESVGPSLSRERFVAAMEGLDFQGIGPRIRFGPDQRQGHQSLYLMRCTGRNSHVSLTDWL
ncbi:MAG: ABC transporter substrate-binding protein [Bacteroidia bacterium]